MNSLGIYLDNIVKGSDKLKHVSKASFNLWACLFVKTQNSSYTIRKVDDKYFEVCGGWFDRKGLSPSRLMIRGCTYGGSALHINMLAACGLRMEFGNNLITSPVNQLIVIKAENLNLKSVNQD